MISNTLLADDHAHQNAVPVQEQLPNPVAFEPSKTTKNLGLATLKKEMHIAGLELPGIFEVYLWIVTVFAFLFMLILEIATAYISYNEADVDGFIIVGTVLGDWLFAFIAHRKKAQEQRLKNEIILAKGVDVDQKELELKYCKRWSILFSAFIIGSGVIKFVFFQESWGVFDGTSWAVMCFVIICILINIYFTGYFLYTLHFYARLRSENNEWAKSRGNQYSVVDYNPQPIQNEGIALKEMQVGQHRLYLLNGTYFIDTYGILTDKELVEFTKRQQSPSAKVIVAKACLQAQLDSLNN
ncbi:MAG: hypothetical protein KA536_11465 [Saprospiraceae bacterium]|nr:hypothetical protein [Saprospiraceae bacterium]